MRQDFFKFNEAILLVINPSVMRIEPVLVSSFDEKRIIKNLFIEGAAKKVRNITEDRPARIIDQFSNGDFALIFVPNDFESKKALMKKKI